MYFQLSSSGCVETWQDKSVCFLLNSEKKPRTKTNQTDIRALKEFSPCPVPPALQNSISFQLVNKHYCELYFS